MIIMGVDIGSRKTGICILENKRKNNWKVNFVTTISFSQGTHSFQRIDEYKRQFHEIVKDNRPSIVILEGLAYGFRNKSLVVLAEMSYITREYLFKKGIPFLELPPKSLKKFVTGKGNASKEDMKSAIIKRWNFNTGETSDEYDAFGLCIAAFSKLKLIKDLPIGLDSLNNIFKFL